MVHGNRDEVPGTRDQAARARPLFHYEPPAPVPLLTVPQALSAVAYLTMLASLIELLRKTIVGWL